ncbi:MAG TPA: MFS transporter [Steroidobacteraceae bacterium]|nr:MFS transporter [Steroidobacteraceae bacterium]
MVALCFLLSMLDGADLLIMSFIAPVLSFDWSVSPERLGVLFSASLLGMAIGCLFVAPFADKYGRRVMIIAALSVTAAAMLLSAFSSSVSELMVARLFVGIGVGTIGVTMTTMAAEYAPRRHTSFAVGFVQAGWPFGSIITAFAAARVLPVHGWQSMLMGIGLISAVLLILVFFLLPESLSFLLLRRPPDAHAKINGLRRRLRLDLLGELPPVEIRPRGIRVRLLFGGGRMIPSLLLWSAVTLGYFDLYFVISWIPKLAAQAGLPLAQAIYAGATYNLGAFIGTAAIGGIAIRYPLNRVIASYLSLAAAAMLVFGGVAMPVAMTLVMALIIGVTVQGGFNGFWALAAKLYPAGMRSTGVGWALGVGRIGAVLGPIVGGLMVGAHVPLGAIFAAYALPLLAAAFMTSRISVQS